MSTEWVPVDTNIVWGEIVSKGGSAMRTRRPRGLGVPYGPGVPTDQANGAGLPSAEQGLLHDSAG